MNKLKYGLRMIFMVLAMAAVSVLLAFAYWFAQRLFPFGAGIACTLAASIALVVVVRVFGPDSTSGDGGKDR